MTMRRAITVLLDFKYKIQPFIRFEALLGMHFRIGPHTHFQAFLQVCIFVCGIYAQVGENENKNIRIIDASGNNHSALPSPSLHFSLGASKPENASQFQQIFDIDINQHRISTKHLENINRTHPVLHFHWNISANFQTCLNESDFYLATSAATPF